VTKIRVTQIRSKVDQSEKHRGTLRALGLGRIGKTNELEATPESAGMLRKVAHLVRVEDA